MANPLLLIAGLAALAAPHIDRDTVAQLDRTYQKAVKRNDAETMDKIMHPDFQLVLGDGRRYGREDLLNDARRGTFVYELQDEEPGSQSVIVCGDTAIVTAKLLMKGTTGGKPFERALWFSDTYVRTDGGWRYLFGQASLPLTPKLSSGQSPPTAKSENSLALNFWPRGAV